MPHMTLHAIEDLATAALQGAGASQANARSVARSTRRAERDGVRSHGLMYVPIYAEHVACGKVDGKAEPQVTTPKPALVRVDARTGFAHPAIDAGFEAMVAAARSQGVGVMSIFNSYNCGVLGHHAERIAEAGLLALCFTNAPASIAPTGGSKPVDRHQPVCTWRARRRCASLRHRPVRLCHRQERDHAAQPRGRCHRGGLGAGCGWQPDH